MTQKRSEKKEKPQEEGLSFEAAMTRLEKIVGEMESGPLGLEDMIARFEEGQALARFCTGKLNEIERKIEVLVKTDAGVETRPFDPGALAGDHPSGAGQATGAEKPDAESDEDVPF